MTTEQRILHAIFGDAGLEKFNLLVALANARENEKRLAAEIKAIEGKLQTKPKSKAPSRSSKLKRTGSFD